MRNSVKFLGIIALVVVMGFSFTACPDGDTTPTPVADDYTFGNLSQIAGSVTAVSIIPKEGKSPSAVSNIRYAGNTDIPQTVGTYAVTFDVAAAEGWNEAKGLSAGNLAVKGWTAVTDSTFDTTNIRGIAYGNGRWVAVGWGNKMAYSADGIIWIAVADSPLGNSSIQGVAYSGGRWVAGGGGGKMAYWVE